MNEPTPLNPKVNSLMNLFKRQAPQPLPPQRPLKKVKANEEYLPPHPANSTTPSTKSSHGATISLLAPCLPHRPTAPSPLPRSPKPTPHAGPNICRASSSTSIGTPPPCTPSYYLNYSETTTHKLVAAQQRHGLRLG